MIINLGYFDTKLRPAIMPDHNFLSVVYVCVCSEPFAELTGPKLSQNRLIKVKGCAFEFKPCNQMITS